MYRTLVPFVLLSSIPAFGQEMPYPTNPAVPPGPYATSPTPQTPSNLPPVNVPAVQPPPRGMPLWGGETTSADPSRREKQSFIPLPRNTWFPLQQASPPQPTAPPPVQFPTPAPVVAPPRPTPGELKFEPYWNNGLFFRTADKGFVAHVGGALHYDGAWYSGGTGIQNLPGGVGRFNDGVNARRLRMYMEGSYYDSFDYKMEIEVMNGVVPAGLTGPATAANVSNSPGPTDAWVTVKNVPWVGNVRIGNQKEWFSLEHIESYKSLLYMERSYLFDFAQNTAFNNGFSPGVSTFRTWADDRLFTAVGVYKNESDLLGFGLGDGNYAVTGRVAYLPLWVPDEQTYWHVGGAMSHRDPVAGRVPVRIRNAVRNAPFPLLNLIANTGPINASGQTLFNLESAFASGPLTVSGEMTTNMIYGASVAGGPNVGTVVYNGFYTQAMVFLTGEHREWDPKLGAFKRVVPVCQFDPKAGTWGGVEVGGRYTLLDLDDRGINGGRLNNVTLGLTWYWNANVRLQVNYDYLYRDGGTNPLVKGSIHSLGTRLAMDF